MPEDLTLYKFLPAKYGLELLESRLMKVGTADSLNDPFELLPALPLVSSSNADKAIRTRSQWYKTAAETLGVVCLSGTITDPAVWSHYADGHTGVAIEMKFSPERQKKMIKVIYDKPERLPYPTDPNFLIDDIGEFFEELLRYKGESWQFEEEYRFVVLLGDRGCQRRGGLYFIPIGDSDISGVILGCRCQLDEAYVERVLDDFGTADVRRAHVSDDRYEMEVEGLDFFTTKG